MLLRVWNRKNWKVTTHNGGALQTLNCNYECFKNDNQAWCYELQPFRFLCSFNINNSRPWINPGQPRTSVRARCLCLALSFASVTFLTQQDYYDPLQYGTLFHSYCICTFTAVMALLLCRYQCSNCVIGHHIVGHSCSVSLVHSCSVA